MALVGRDRALTPDEFWRMSPDEVHWLLEARKPTKMYGKMTEDEVKELYEEAYGTPDEPED